MKIVLGSASPRRRELLSQIGLDFEIVVSDVEEKVTSTVPSMVVEELSAQKAEGVWQLLKSKDKTERQKNAVQKQSADNKLLVIGADTIVACDGKILGKPKDVEDAKAMLKMLQGRAHEVYTGVTVLYGKKSETEDKCVEDGWKTECRTFHETTKVVFFPMTEAEIDSYVATGDPLDKAGAYGIQGLCARYISGIEGDYNNVVGLPVGRLYQEIREWL